MIESFRDEWLAEFYWKATQQRQIPASIRSSLLRKLDIVHVANMECDLRSPPGNRFEYLKGKLSGYCSVRVNRQYRLIFRWPDGKATDLYPDPHKY